MEQAHCIGEAEIDQGTEARAGLRLEQRIAHPELRARVERRRDDIEVAGQDEGFLEGEQLARMRRQAVHPVEFVGEFVGADRIAIGQIDRGDPDDARSPGITASI